MIICYGDLSRTLLYAPLLPHDLQKQPQHIQVSHRKSRRRITALYMARPLLESGYIQ
ncbi:hypothetical protein X975_06146, partial [Stegodyphus mimosarum]